LSEFEGHFCCYKWQNALCSPSATTDLLVFVYDCTFGWRTSVCVNAPPSDRQYLSYRDYMAIKSEVY